MTNLTVKISNELGRLINHIKENLIEEFSQREITVEAFVFYSMLDKNTLVYRAVNRFLSTIIIDAISNDLFKMVSKDEYTALRPTAQVVLSDDFAKLIYASDKQREKLGRPKVTTDHILLAILDSDTHQKIKEIFNRAGLTYNILLAEVEKIYQTLSLVEEYEGITEDADISSLDPSKNDGLDHTVVIVAPAGTPKLSMTDVEKLINSTTPSQKKKPSSGIKYCKNLNGLASIGKLDEVVGRDKEIKQIVQVLSRRKNNNAILVGMSGSGKTAIVEGLALKIHNGVAPRSISNKTIFSLRVTEMVAGTSMRGMFEERLSKVFIDLKNTKNCILFIDDIHMVANSSKKDEYDILGSINEYVTNSDVQIILATTQDGYRSLMNTNKDMKRRFQRIDVDPLTVPETIEILNKAKKEYEEYHRVKYSDEAIKVCAKLSERYMSDIAMPSSAFDILDEAGAMKKLSISEPEGLTSKLEAFKALSDEKAQAIAVDNMDEADNIAEKMENLKAEISELAETNGITEDDITVNEDDIRKTISIHTGIPIEKITTSDKKVLSNIEEILKSKIIGQDEAIKVLSSAIRRNKVGLTKKGRPILSAFMCGRTGVGKTLTAKTLAKEVFGNEKYLVRFDMSEYADKTSLNKLIGTGAGYVGYDNGGLLTEAIKNRKYAVLLFDEIEKADYEIYNLLLQVIEDGVLTDNMGNKVDFSNTIILFTSNVGSRESDEYTHLGFTKESDNSSRDIMERELKKQFPPEFINRLDAIVYYNNLTDESMRNIVRLEIDKLNDRLKENNFEITYDEKVIDFILSDTKDERKYGARPIIRSIEKYIEYPLVDDILSNDYESHKYTLTADKDTLHINA